MNNNARGTSEGSSGDDSDIGKKIDELSENVRGLRITLAEMRAERAFAEENSKQLVNKAEKLVESRLASADEVISKLEDKLSHFYITSPNGNGKGSGDFDSLESTLAKISEKLDNVVDKDYVQGLANDTLEAITDMRLEVLTASDKSKKTKISAFDKLNHLINFTGFVKNGNRFKSIETQLNDIVKHIDESTVASENFYSLFGKENEILKDEIANLSKLEKVMVQTGENVLDVKRRVEFGVHQILLEVNDLIKENSNDLGTNISKR